MKKKELMATLDELADAMGRIDCRAMMAKGLEDNDMADEVGSRRFDAAVERMECLALGYVAAMVDAIDIARGEDEVGDADEYAAGTMQDMVEARSEIIAQRVFRSLDELLNGTGDGE